MTPGRRARRRTPARPPSALRSARPDLLSCRDADCDGTTPLATIYLDNRELVHLDDVSPIARRAVLNIEDAGFYDHGALNWSSILRAMGQRPSLEHALWNGRLECRLLAWDIE